MDVEEISLTTEDHRLRKSERLWTRPTVLARADEVIE
jgi:hypothetical protein